MTVSATHKGRPPANKGKTYPPEVLTAEEVYALINACGQGACGKRNRAMIMVGWRAGLRVNEVLDLLPKDVDLEHGRIQVLHGKGDKRRVVAIDPVACEVIARWLVARRDLGCTDSQPLFCVVTKPTTGERMHNAQVRVTMSALRKRAGIEKRVHFHGLRHSYAAYLMDRGVPMHHIKAMLGHTSLVTTQRYCDHINPAHVVEQVRALVWPQMPSGNGLRTRDAVDRFSAGKGPS